MIKFILLINGKETESYKDFEARMHNMWRNVALDPLVERLKMTLTNVKPPSMSIIPFKREKIAVISIYSETDSNSMINSLLPMSDGAYIAEEALPVSYEINWPEGSPTPGVCLLTLFRKKPGIDYETFIHQWHHSHTPLSLEIHPLWNYNRNVVKAVPGSANKPWDGIVEEQVRYRSDLMNPFKFFGNPLVILQRMWAVYTDTKKFLEYKTVSPYLATEYWLKR